MRHKRQSGQALVEFALILPILVLILMGIFDFGRAFYASSAVANAAREGARVGVIANATDANIRSAVQAMAVGLEWSQVTVQIAPSPTRVSGGTVRVTVTYSYVPVTPLIESFLPGGRLALTSAATMYVE